MIVDPRSDVISCHGNECTDGYVPDCMRCYVIEVQCQSCKRIVTFPRLADDKDYIRGDHFLRDLSAQCWMCPECGAVDMSRPKNAIDKTEQMTLEGFK